MHRTLKVLLFFTLCGTRWLASPIEHTNTADIAEYRLFNDLFRDYNSLARPRKDPSETVTINISYFLNSIGQVSEKMQTITLVGWAEMEWYDELLVWDPSNYGDIELLVASSEKIWIPDVVFFNGVNQIVFDSKKFPPVLRSDGSVLYSPGGPVTISCVFYLRSYPFDEHVCAIDVNSWSSPRDKIQLVAGEFQKDNATPHGEWSIIRSNVRSNDYTESGGNYTEIFFELTIRRKALYHILNIILPIALLSLLNLTVFLLPADSGEKVSLSTTVLLSFSVWLLMLNGITPSASDYLPLMGIYITTFMIISTVSVGITVYVIRIHSKNDAGTIPSWLRGMQRFGKKLCRARKGDSDSHPIEDDTRFSWKRVAATIDEVALTFLLICILVLMGVVSGGLISK